MTAPRFSLKFPLHLLLAAGLAGPAIAQEATQSVPLVAGWNAVWLEVAPVDAAGNPQPPEVVFSNPAIQLAATPKPLAAMSEIFASEPGTISTFNQDDWQQWKRSDPAGLNNLPNIAGNRAYLIQVAAGTPDFSVQITGKARFFHPEWIPDCYNLAGFGLESGMTFDQFFGPSGAKHPAAKIFKLSPNGAWAKVTGAATMEPDRAYWIFCAGPSNYMGPVSAGFDLDQSGRLGFGGPSDAVAVGSGADRLQLDLKELTFSNLGSAAAVPALDLISKSGDGLALHVVNPAADSLGHVRGNTVDSAVGPGASAALGKTVAPQQTASLTLGALRSWSDDAPRVNLYRLKTGGASFWLPVTAVRSDLQQLAGDGTPAGGVTGLWIGDMVANGVTSIVEDGAPVRPSAGSAPLRVMLHSDSGGLVRLLSQVTVMRTKTADPAIAPAPVLVVDPARIPFFEGIKERNGKRVGVRFDAIAYDMPRLRDAASQSDLINDPHFLALTSLSPALQDALAKDPTVRTSADKALIAASTATIDSAKAAIPSLLPDYLISSSLRPPKLKEAYQLSLPVSGSLGAGQTVTATFNLDPFHRSNPFRHAYHQNLPKGPDINRTLAIAFDAGQTDPDRLTGVFTDTIRGLIKSDLTVSGRVDLRRVSPVATLEGAQ
jgi:hypothetical protein